jgi:hypothetical protein
MGPRSDSDSRKVRLMARHKIHSKTFRGNRVRDYFPSHCFLADYHRSKCPAPPQTLTSFQDYALATIIKSARNWMSERPNLSDIRLALVLPM